MLGIEICTLQNSIKGLYAIERFYRFSPIRRKTDLRSRKNVLKGKFEESFFGRKKELFQSLADFRSRLEKKTECLIGPGLPDFCWYNTPKREKYTK
jgi:hypothetical protein